MKCFEYNLVVLPQQAGFDCDADKIRTEATIWMNSYGQEGWEIAHFYADQFGVRLLLKREIS
jgi:hypothetical protein